MKLNSGIFPLVAAVLLLLPAHLSAEQQVYKWVDENGVVHFDDNPPPDREFEAIEATEAYRPGGSGANAGTPTDDPSESELTAAQQTRADLAAQTERRKAEQEQIRKVCDHYREVVAELEPHRRVFYENEDGETVRMDDEERVAQVESAKAFLESNCKA